MIHAAGQDCERAATVRCDVGMAVTEPLQLKIAFPRNYHLPDALGSRGNDRTSHKLMLVPLTKSGRGQTLRHLQEET
jgi:hypothetical protein